MHVGNTFTYTLIISAHTPILYEISGMRDIRNVTERDLESGDTYETDVPYMYGYVPTGRELNRHWFEPGIGVWL